MTIEELNSRTMIADCPVIYEFKNRPNIIYMKKDDHLFYIVTYDPFRVRTK